ncbi:hypothetical protein ATW55_02670 [Ferroacidibacillus organovorans]|uniref:ABC transporter domain-containing protein n=1 Tax=Ferroacidibacillus organovorans TaxID=1765683 RepID=A0A101XR45_9BACL|nr:hypothetical protein ATW55_02670 [Ferroacidibacillus organovorans]
MLLTLKDVVLHFGGQPVLRGANLDVKRGERVALIGPNGAGKSTLMNVAAGTLTPESGSRAVERNATIGHVMQRKDAHADETVWRYARSAFADVDELETAMRALEAAIANASRQGEMLEKLLRDYDAKTRAFEQRDGFSADAKTRRVLHGLRFTSDQYDTPFTSLSGGQKTRLQLARQLLIEPDLLMLDEPTNYLDLETLAWLEDYLRSYRGSLLVISHDRYFLDRVTTVTYALDRGQTVRYPGNYSVCAALKEEREAQQVEAFERQQAEIERIEDFIAKNIVRASTTKRAQSRRTWLARLERVEQPTARKLPFVNFLPETTSGVEVLEIRRFSAQVGTPGRNLFAPVSLTLRRGERVALLGKNGVGKTSLLRAIAGVGKGSGDLRFGTNVELGYYTQEQEQLDPALTVLETLWRVYPTRAETVIRTKLGHVLFHGDDVYKRVGDLSGGERSRLALAILSLSSANLLLLDEPTNHLDIESKEALEAALLDFPGTIFFVSHDRYFLATLATRILSLSEDRLIDFAGDYEAFLASQAQTSDDAAKAKETVRAAHVTPSSEPSSTKDERERKRAEKSQDRKRQARLAAVEQQIAHLEEEIKVDETRLVELSERGDWVAINVQNERLQEKNECLAAAYREWETLSEEM